VPKPRALPIVRSSRRKARPLGRAPEFLLRLALLLFALAAAAHGEDWTIVSANSEPGRAGVFHRHIVLENAATAQIAVDLAIFSTKSCTLRVIQNENGAASLGDMMRQEECLAGVNGGYFNDEFAPIGLRIVNGQMIAPLQRARLITGVLVASSRGLQIVRAREFSQHQKILAAIQCGPFLVDGSRRVPGLNALQRARRTFAATGTNGRALLAVCSEISLADLATVLATTPIAGDLKIERALNFDGGSSSAFWFARENGSVFSIPERKPVRDFVALVPK
jgi:exopolysaccharide biosynthesis protein